MAEPLSLHVLRFLRDRDEYERSLPPALLVFSPPPSGGKERPVEEDDDYHFRTQSNVVTPMMGVGEPLVFTVTKQRENAFGRGITVGRTGNNDVVLDDGTVSRFHGWFQRDSAGVLGLTDAGSKNGSFVEGVRLVPKRLVPVSDGARLRFGQVGLIFYEPRGFMRMIARRARP